MSKDEEIEALQQKNRELKERVTYLEAQLQALQEQVSKDSHTSLKPPSSDGFKRRTKSLRTKSGKKPGGQQGHRGYHLQRVEKPDEIVVHVVSSCKHCGHALGSQPATHPESRHVFDVPPKPLWVVEHRAEEKRCPHCDERTRAAFPHAVRAPAQYGPGLAGLAVYLVEGQCVPTPAPRTCYKSGWASRWKPGVCPAFSSGVTSSWRSLKSSSSKR